MPIPRRATLVSILFILILPFAAAKVAGQDNQTASLSGRVLDARSGEALAKVKVIVSGTDKETTTDEAGKFALDNLNASPKKLVDKPIGPAYKS